METKPVTRRLDLLEPDLSYAIIAAFYRVYKGLKTGLMESLYSRAMERVLREYGLKVDREFGVPVFFEGEQLGFHRFDLLVEERVIVEVKSTEHLPPTAKRQLRGYLAATGLELGLLLHFGNQACHHRVLGPRRPKPPTPSSS